MKNILIVDDHPLIRLGMESTVLKVIEDSIVFHAGTLNEAQLKMGMHTMDMIILDLSIPDSTGMAMIALLRRLQPKVPILIFSGRDEMINAPHCISMEANGFLPKNATDEESELAILTVMDNKMYLRSNVQTQILDNFMHRRPILPNPIESLTPREKEILELLILGKWTKEISEDLNIKFSTVSTHKSRILEKMGVQNTVELYKKVEDYVGELKSIL